MSQVLWGGIDAGGTTFKCGVADESGRLLRTHRVAVGDDPPAVIAACAAFFDQARAETGGALRALGVGSFGPLDLDRRSATFGSVMATPKPGWAGFDLLGALSRAVGAPAALDTDVNAALAAEMRWGAARGAASAAYVTVGAGIGAGIFANGEFLGRPAHPEFGHIPVRRAPGDDNFPGICPFHRDCLEGMASAKALTARAGDPKALEPDHPAWTIEAHYLGQCALVLYLTARPEAIVLGGGLLLAEGLIEKTRAAFLALLADYLPMDADGAAALIRLPGLGDDAGLYGGIHLAMSAGGGSL